MKEEKKWDLFAFEASADVSELFVNPNPLKFLVPAVTYITDEHR